MATLPSIEVLEAHHVFPGRYTFKAFGPGTDEFEASARSAVAHVMGPTLDVIVSRRASAAGKYVCVTLDVHLESAHQVHRVYHRLLALPGLAMLL